MRSCIALIIILIRSVAMGQDWALINPAYRYNYSDDGTDTISNQIKVTHQEALGPETTQLEFNRTAQLCYDCWPDCALRLGIPQFLGASCTVSGTTWTFDEPIERVIRSKAQVGEAWLFEPENGANATLTSIEEVELLGIVDSIRTMVTDFGDTVIWSKGMGVVRWSMHDSVPVELIGVQGLDIGVRIPSLGEFFPYQAGDIVETRRSTWQTSNSSIRHTYKRYEILERNEETPGQLSFATNYSSRTENSSGQYYWYEYGQEILNFDLADPVLSPVLSSPKELVELGGPLFNSWMNDYPPMQMVAEHYLDDHGRYVIESQPGVEGRVFSAIDPVDTIGCFEFTGGGWVFGHYLIDNELGIRSRYLESYPDHESFSTIGAILSGDTIGFIHGETFFGVGISEGTIHRSDLAPTIAAESIALTLTPPRIATWKILSMSGQVLREGLTDADQVSWITVADLAAGAYILRLDEQQPTWHRFLVQH